VSYNEPAVTPTNDIAPDPIESVEPTVASVPVVPEALPGDQVSYNEPVVAPEIETSVEEPSTDVVPDPIESAPEVPTEPVTPPADENAFGSVEIPVAPVVSSAEPVVETVEAAQPERKVGFLARFFGKKS